MRSSITVGGPRPVVELECPHCHEFAPAGATTCAECGSHLFVRQGSGTPFEKKREGDIDPRCEDVIGCTCGHAGACIRCYLHLIDSGFGL